MYCYKKLKLIDWIKNSEDGEALSMKWVLDAVAFFEENEILKKNEEGELFEWLNPNIKHMKMESNNCFYINLGG